MSDDPIIFSDLCDEHEWAGTGGCPFCEREAKYEDHVQGRREDEKLARERP